MSVQGAFAFKSPVVSTATGLAKAVRDPVMSGDNGGTRFIADLGFGFSYPGGAIATRPAPTNPVASQTVYDVTEQANGIYRLPGSGVTYSGNGFDYTNATTVGSHIELPASVAADIFTAVGGVAQRFLACAYVKIPTQANWNTLGTIGPLLDWGQYTTEASLITMGLSSTQGQLTFRRQTAAATAEISNLVLNTLDYGSVVQIACWRTAAGFQGRVRSVNGIVSGNLVTGADNTQDFSAKVGRFGFTPAFWGPGATAKAFRTYRCFLINLARDSRDPIATIDADYTRVVARGVFS